MKTCARLALIGTVIGSCIGCDQATKVLAHQQLAGRGAVSLLGDTIRLSYVENAGAFLSLGAGLSSMARFWLFGVAVAVGLAILAIAGATDRAANTVRLTSVALLIGGGLGNLIDRANLGVVRDFLNVGVGSIRTGIFNVADLAVTVGAIALLSSSWGGRDTVHANRPRRL